jgi:hypothetical protein
MEVKMERKFMYVVVMGLITLFFFIVPSFAQEEVPGNIKLGPAEVHPYIKTQVQYDSNIFLRQTNKKDDIIVTAQPGLRLDIPFGQGKESLLRADYSAAYNRFIDYKDQSNTAQYAKGLLALRFTKFYIDLKDDFSWSTDRASSEIITRLYHRDNTFDAMIGTRWNKLGLEVGYENFYTHYHREPNQIWDRNDHTGMITGYYQIFPKTQALLEYDYSQINYTKDPARGDIDYQQALVGLKGNLTGKITALMKAGWQGRHYEPGVNKDYDSMVGTAKVTANLSELTKVDLKYDHTIEESSGLTQLGYKVDRGTVTLTQRLMDRLTGLVSYGLEDARYLRDGNYGREKWDLWSVEPALIYRFGKHFSTTLSYKYLEKDSNIAGNDYKDNLVTLSFSALF